MPLLKKKTLEKAQVDEFLRDDEEVFHCVMTNEVFRDYDEFAERTILCNSMVWTCSMTGKSNLTYEEALQSEENAKKMLNDFSPELRIPMLYIANLIKRSSFSDMADDVFVFVRDHYFIGEIIEACTTGNNKWKKYHVLSVILPTEKEITEVKTNAKEGEDQAHLLSRLYRYVIAPVDNKEDKTTASFVQIRRKKNIFSKERSKLFLKQYVEPSSNGISIKSSALDSYKITTMKFEEIFAGTPPTFAKRTKPLGHASLNGKKKVRQETLTKFLSKNNILLPKDDKEKAAEEAKRKERELKKEQEREERERQKQLHNEITMKMRDWNIINEDLLLEDHSVLPTMTPIKSKIPDKLLGDVFGIMEFANNFANILSTKDYFSQGINLQLMEKVLLETRPSSPMNDFVQMLLQTLFDLQGSEKKNYGRKRQGKVIASDDTQMSDDSAIWTARNYGSRLYDLPMHALTVTEILRLHFLCSGENISESGVKWRLKYRGGYTSEEDDAIRFRLHNPHIMKALSFHHVCQLSVTDKLKVLSCLVSQLLSMRELRDEIEKNHEIPRTAKVQLKTNQVNERKRVASVEQQIATLAKRTTPENAEETTSKINRLRENSEKIKKEYDAEQVALNNKMYSKSTVLGYDRAYRAYLKLNSLPGFVVNHEDFNIGGCLPEVTHHVPELVGAGQEQILNYLHKMSEELNSSDKENDQDREHKQNGVKGGAATKLATLSKLHMCSADPLTCVIHSTSTTQTHHRWAYCPSMDTVDALIKALNKRGLREGDLKATLEVDYSNLQKLLGRRMTMPNASTSRTTRSDIVTHDRDCPTDEALHWDAVDSILKLEKKLFNGYLGGISKEREMFRQLILDNNYELIDDLTRTKPKHIPQEFDEGDEKATPSANDFEDPGAYLNNRGADIDSEDSDLESDEVLLTQTSDERKAIKFVAYALAQIAMTIKPNFLLKPLGAVMPRKTKKDQLVLRSNSIALWVQSLMHATSYSQILLHYNVLDDCIIWSKSASSVKCRKCWRGSDGEKILICEYCNDGYHLYCLKPQLHEVPEDSWYCKSCAETIEKLKQEEDSETEEETDSSEDRPEACIICGFPSNEDTIICNECKAGYHIECANLKRSVRGAWTCNQCKDGAERHANSEHSSRRSGRNNDSNEDMPLNNAALQEVLRDVMKHEDAWPFIRPVTKNEVPDYFDIIKKPMDFGTIKYKLNMGDYQYDDEVIADCQLVFDNCHTYNSADDEVFKCGRRLVKYFIKKCKDLKVEFHADFAVGMNGDDANDQEGYEPPRKSRRMR